MTLEINTPEQIAHAISRLEKNIEVVKHSNFCFKEKKDLKEIYKAQIANYKRKQVSFYNHIQN